MSYLQPPPNMAPVVVVKDYGGYVNEYAAQTEIYRRTRREVRIHECHSACTMALSLPNVCVYKDSIFKFHQAYNPLDHVTNWTVTDELYHTYPEAIRERLGTPTKTFTILRGTELIGLGIRDCAEPVGPPVIIAQATIKPIPNSVLSGGSSVWSTVKGKLGGIVPNLGGSSETAPQEAPNGPTTTPRRAPPLPAGVLAPDIPLPPQRPNGVETAELEGAPQPDGGTSPGDIPLPPPRPKILVAYTPSLPPIPYMQRIEGSAPILPARFTPFPRKAT